MLDDREIIHRCRGGQRHLLDMLIDRYKDALYSLCMRLARNVHDADDLFQDTWVNVMRNLDTFSLERKFSTWLFAVCINRYRDRYRWRKRWLRRIKDITSGRLIPGGIAGQRDKSSCPQEDFIRNEQMEAVRKKVDSLDDMHRLPIIFFYFHELSVEEIGRILEIPQGTVKSRLSRGRKIIKELMEGAGHGES